MQISPGAMVTVRIIHHSVTGTTSRLAQAVLEGAAGIRGCRAEVLAIDGADIVNGKFENDAMLRSVDTADAVIFGCPTLMGGASAQFKAFADASSDRWAAQRWEGKLCAGFTVGSCASGDQLATLLYFTVLAAQHGMLWVGLNIPGGHDPQGRNRLGAQLGLIAQSTGTTVPTVDLDTASYFGARVAQKAMSLHGRSQA